MQNLNRIEMTADCSLAMAAAWAQYFDQSLFPYFTSLLVPGLKQLKFLFLRATILFICYKVTMFVLCCKQGATSY